MSVALEDAHVVGVAVGDDVLASGGRFLDGRAQFTVDALCHSRSQPRLASLSGLLPRMTKHARRRGQARTATRHPDEVHSFLFIHKSLS